MWPGGETYRISVGDNAVIMMYFTGPEDYGYPTHYTEQASKTALGKQLSNKNMDTITFAFQA